MLKRYHILAYRFLWSFHSFKDDSLPWYRCYHSWHRLQQRHLTLSPPVVSQTDTCNCSTSLEQVEAVAVPEVQSSRVTPSVLQLLLGRAMPSEDTSPLERPNYLDQKVITAVTHTAVQILCPFFVILTQRAWWRGLGWGPWRGAPSNATMSSAPSEARASPVSDAHTVTPRTPNPARDTRLCPGPVLSLL